MLLFVGISGPYFISKFIRRCVPMYLACGSYLLAIIASFCVSPKFTLKVIQAYAQKQLERPTANECKAYLSPYLRVS